MACAEHDQALDCFLKGNTSAVLQHLSGVPSNSSELAVHLSAGRHLLCVSLDQGTLSVTCLECPPIIWTQYLPQLDPAISHCYEGKPEHGQLTPPLAQVIPNGARQLQSFPKKHKLH
jgi:hypothetical protein